MKKKVKIVMIILLIVVLAVCAWFIGYHTRKSQDNLPSLESENTWIWKMDEHTQLQVSCNNKDLL